MVQVAAVVRQLRWDELAADDETTAIEEEAGPAAAGVAAEHAAAGEPERAMEPDADAAAAALAAAAVDVGRSTDETVEDMLAFLDDAKARVDALPVPAL